MTNVVVLFGPPGSGKGTQAKILASQKADWVHISTGDLFRAEIASGSSLGTSVKEILKSGKLVSDDVTTNVFESQVRKILKEKTPSVLLLDGYPRTGPQGASLAKFSTAANALKAPFVVELGVSKDEIVGRLSGRLVNTRTGKVYHKLHNPPKTPMICDDDGGPLIQRDDDKEETIVKRYNTYVTERDAVISSLKAPVEKIQGVGDMSRITTELLKVVEKNISK